MPSNRQLEIAEELFELAPTDTYASRGASLVARMGGLTAWRVELDGGTPLESPTGTDGTPLLSLPLAGHRGDAGVLHLYGKALAEELIPVLRWGARLYARGLRYSARIGRPRTKEDIHAMLERTPLTPRERDVVGRLLSGSSTREIASSTGLTVATVNTYLKRIFAKLGVHSRVELVARVTGTRGVIPSGPDEASV